MPLPKVTRIKLGRRVRKARKKRRKPTAFQTVKVPAYLTRCETMGYEVWSDKPERIPQSEGGGFRALVDWNTPSKAGTFYFRLPDVDHVPMESSMHLNNGGMRKIWLHIDLTMRKKVIHIEHAKGE